MASEHPTARSVRDLEPPDVRRQLDALEREQLQATIEREGASALDGTLRRVSGTRAATLVTPAASRQPSPPSPQRLARIAARVRRDPMWRRED